MKSVAKSTAYYFNGARAPCRTTSYANSISVSGLPTPLIIGGIDTAIGVATAGTAGLMVVTTGAAFIGAWIIGTTGANGLSFTMVGYVVILGIMVAGVNGCSSAGWIITRGAAGTMGRATCIIGARATRGWTILTGVATLVTGRGAATTMVLRALISSNCFSSSSKNELLKA